MQQTTNVFYSPIEVTGRKAYRQGDKVLASYSGDRVRKITRVLVAWQVPRNEDEDVVVIDIETEDVSA